MDRARQRRRHLHTGRNFPGLLVIFDIDGGFVPGDGATWQSVLNLCELKAPLDPEPADAAQPRSRAAGWRWTRGRSRASTRCFAHYIQAAGVYYLEVTAAGQDGVPLGVDYTLQVSIQQHVQDTFLFSPQPVAEDEAGNNSTGVAQDLDPTATPATNFFTFFDPTVGNTDFTGGGVSLRPRPTCAIVGSAGNGSVDIYEFDVAALDASPMVPTAARHGPSRTTTSLKVTLNGSVVAGNVWNLALNYRDYSYTGGQNGDALTLDMVAADFAARAGERRLRRHRDRRHGVAGRRPDAGDHAPEQHAYGRPVPYAAGPADHPDDPPSTRPANAEGLTQTIQTAGTVATRVGAEGHQRYRHHIALSAARHHRHLRAQRRHLARAHRRRAVDFRLRRPIRPTPPPGRGAGRPPGVSNTGDHHRNRRGDFTLSIEVVAPGGRRQVEQRAGHHYQRHAGGAAGAVFGLGELAGSLLTAITGRR